MKIKLSELIGCDIYRDGGSLEGIWSTTDHKEWVVTLAVHGDWDSKNFDNRNFKLYACRLNDTKNHSPIKKNSAEHHDLVETINTWLAAKKIHPENPNDEKMRDNRLYDLLFALKKGNF